MSIQPDCWYNVRIKSTAAWPSAQYITLFEGHELTLKPVTTGTEPSIHVSLNGLTVDEAQSLISRFLSLLTWSLDWPVESRYGMVNFSAEAFLKEMPLDGGPLMQFPVGWSLQPAGKAESERALALYREGRSNNSIALSFFSYFRILNVFWKDKYQKHTSGGSKNPMIEGIRSTLPKLTEKRSVARRDALQASVSDVARYLYADGRCAVAHANKGTIVDPDKVADLRRLAEDMDVIKALAEYLISTEFGVARWP